MLIDSLAFHSPEIHGNLMREFDRNPDYRRRTTALPKMPSPLPTSHGVPNRTSAITMPGTPPDYSLQSRMANFRTTRPTAQIGRSREKGLTTALSTPTRIGVGNNFMCSKCGEEIRGVLIRAHLRNEESGGVYHRHCFTCHFCGINLVNIEKFKIGYQKAGL